MPNTLPFVTVVVPTLNEEHYIEACLASLADGLRDLRCEILILDGGSTDRTVELVTAIRSKEIAIVHNPGRSQSAAVNLGATLASPEATVLLRADAHARYPRDFVRTCLTALMDHDATSVVVPMNTEGTIGLQRAVAAVQNSHLGNGGSAHRVGGTSRFVDHGHHAAFDRAFFQRLGGYNETFTHNEDAELDLRSARAGGRIWMSCEAAVTYFPRSTLSSVARQYFNHGRGRAKTLILHKLRPRLRQMAPLIILIGCMGSAILAPLYPPVLMLPLAYASICLAWGMVAGARRRDRWLLAMGPVAITMHICWGAGFLATAARQFR